MGNFCCLGCCPSRGPPPPPNSQPPPQPSLDPSSDRPSSLSPAALPRTSPPLISASVPQPSLDPNSEPPSAVSPPADSQLQIDQHFANINDAADLDPLIHYIDQLLSQVKKQQQQSIQSTKPESSKTREFVTSNIEGASKLLEHISAEGEALQKSNLASNLSEEMGNVARRVLKGARSLHWIAAGLSVVAFVLERIHEVSSNFDKCLDLLDTMFVLAKCLQKQYTRMHNQMETLTEMVFAIVEGATTCCSCMTQGKLFKYLFASTDNEKLQGIERVLAKVQGQLTLMIVTDVQQQVPHRDFVSNYEAPYAVGIEERVNEVIKLLDVGGKEQRRAVILYGFGGVGKTTLADCVMSKLDFRGLKHSRIQLADSQSDMKNYQEELYADLTKERRQFKDCSQGRQRLQEVLKKEATFIFIDNALKKEQINDLLPPDLSLPAESRMLLTSRDKHVTSEFQIRGIGCVEYPVEELPPDAAKQFFREIVNKIEQTNSEVEAESISSDKMDAVAEQCHGIPLLLRVFAVYLARHGREPRAYKEMLDALRKGDFSYTDEGLGAKLLYVYHQLRQDEQDAFVDACTYFHGWSKKDIFYVFTQRELNALLDGALMSIDSSDKLVVHDVLRAMGINLGKSSRVRTVDDWKRAVAEKKEIKGIWLPDLESREVFSIESQHVSAVSGSLRVLAVGRQIRFAGECRISLSKLRFLRIENPAEGFPIFERMDTLRYACLIDNGGNSPTSQRLLENIKNMSTIQKLQLHDYGAEKFSDDFRLANSMIELDLSDSKRLEKLPNEFGGLNSLQSLNLNCCGSLVSLPDGFGGLSALQELNLNDCRSLSSLPNEFGRLSALQSLHLRGCENLTTLPEGFGGLGALQELHLEDCRSLSSLPNEFGGLNALQSLTLLGCENLRCLPDGFGGLGALHKLDLEGCRSLSSLPNEFGRLSALQSLDLRGCENLTSLPEGFGGLGALQRLYLNGCRSLSSLPNEFGRLSALQYLDLRRCENLTTLPEGFGGLGALQELDLEGCRSLSSLPNEFGRLSALQYLDLRWCENLTSLPNGFGKLSSLRNLSMSNCLKLKSLSDDFENLMKLEVLEVSGCLDLEGNTIEKLIKLPSLRRLVIQRSVKLKMKWKEIPKENFSFEVEGAEDD